MSRLDDLTAELLAALGLPDNAAAAPEVRQRLHEAWQEGQLAMRVRASAAAMAADRDTPVARRTAAEQRVDGEMRNEGKDPASPLTATERESRVLASGAEHAKWACLALPVTEDFQ